MRMLDVCGTVLISNKYLYEQSLFYDDDDDDNTGDNEKSRYRYIMYA